LIVVQHARRHAFEISPSSRFDSDSDSAARASSSRAARVRSFVRRANESGALRRSFRPFVRSAVGPSSRRRVRATGRVFLFRSNARVPSLALGFTKMYTFDVLWYILKPSEIFIHPYCTTRVARG
jgi:hypothetical protein